MCNSSHCLDCLADNVPALSASRCGILTDQHVFWKVWKIIQSLHLFNFFLSPFRKLSLTASHKSSFYDMPKTSDWAWHVKHPTKVDLNLLNQRLSLFDPLTQQKSQETTGCQISGGSAGYECLEACPQLTVEITLQWQPCLSNVEKAGRKAYVLLVKLQMSWSAPRLISQIEVTKKKKKKQRRTTEQPLWVKLWSVS